MHSPTIDALSGIFVIVYIVVVLFAVVAAVLWFLMPFAVFGTKAKLDLIIAEARQTNAYLNLLVEQGRPAITPRPTLPPVPKA